MTSVPVTGSVRLSCLSAAAVLLLSACASPQDSVYFITKTSTSVVDADTLPAGISFGYDRVEGYAGPRYADGSVFPVASSIESKGKGANREVRQVFATGHAARIVTQPVGVANAAGAVGGLGGSVGKEPPTDDGKGPGNSRPDSQSNERKVVFFGTATSVGLKVGFDATGPLPTSFTLGYKRKELAVIPVNQALQNTSVLGSFTNGVEVAPPPSAAASAARAGVRFEVQQYFATGAAADNLAALDSIRAQFRDNAARALGGEAQFRVAEARQGRWALDALACAQQLSGPGFQRVLANAEALNMFGAFGGVAVIRAANGEEAQRQKYLSLMSLLDVDDTLSGERLRVHKTTVCEWSTAAK